MKRLREEFPGIKLMVDANSAYRMEDWPLLKELENFYLMMIEQPLGWDDLYAHVELQKKLATPICLDECIHTEEQARAAILLGACKIMNIKLGRVGGYHGGQADSRFVRAKRVAGVVRRECWSRESGGRTTLRFRRCRTSRCLGT